MFGLRFTWTSRRLVTLLWLGFWALMAGLTHWPVPEGIRWPIVGGDRVIHLMMYFILTVLGGRVMQLGFGFSARRLVFWSVVYALYGIVDECTQPFFHRTASVGDWLADSMGILMATSILAMYLDKGDEHSPGQ